MFAIKHQNQNTSQHHACSHDDDWITISRESLEYVVLHAVAGGAHGKRRISREKRSVLVVQKQYEEEVYNKISAFHDAATDEAHLFIPKQQLPSL